MNLIEKSILTILAVPLVAVAASIVTIAAATICGVALVACPFTVFWVMWKPTWTEIKAGRMP